MELFVLIIPFIIALLFWVSNKKYMLHAINIIRVFAAAACFDICHS